MNFRPYAPGYGLLTITEQVTKSRTEVTDYVIARLEAAYGHGFRVLKVGGSPESDYDVHLSDDDECGTCECKGFLRHGHCRHLDALQALAAGKL
jgi:hypothetical protein